MDGKIIQEVEGIVNGSGFVRMSEPQTFESVNTPYTISTDFTPKMVFVTTDGLSGFAIRNQPVVYIQASGRSLMGNIQWHERSVSFITLIVQTTVVIFG